MFLLFVEIIIVAALVFLFFSLITFCKIIKGKWFYKNNLSGSFIILKIF